MPQCCWQAHCWPPARRTLRDVATYEDRLAAAGFVKRIADTPERHAMLRRLPVDQFVIRQSASTLHYVCADPLVCGCLSLGAEQAFQHYLQNRRMTNLASQEQLVAQMDEDAGWPWADSCADRWVAIRGTRL